MLRLRDDILAPLRAHLETNAGERLFRFNDGGHFKHLLTHAKLAVCGLPCPVRRPTGWKPPEYRLAFVGFHSFRHTWASWMRRYGGADVQGPRSDEELARSARCPALLPRRLAGGMGPCG
jgi:integrase